MESAKATFAENAFVCRFCGKVKQSEDLNTASYHEIVRQICLLCINIGQLLEIDNLPKRICLPCKDEVECAYGFLKNLKSVQEHLLNRVKVESEAEDLDIHIRDAGTSASKEIKTETEVSDRNNETRNKSGNYSNSEVSQQLYHVPLMYAPYNFPPNVILNQASIKNTSHDEAKENLSKQNKILDHTKISDNDSISDHWDALCGDGHSSSKEDQDSSNDFVYAKFDVYIDTEETDTQVKKKRRRKAKTLKGKDTEKEKVIKKSRSVLPVNTTASLWNQYDWTCAHCAEKCINIDALRAHSKAAHSKCCAFKCADCTETRNDFTLFLDHVRGHIQFYRNICPYCSETVDAEELSRHVENHFGRFQTPCPACGEIFDNKKLLRKHMCEYGAKDYHDIRLPPKITKTFNCDGCCKVFPALYLMKRHRIIHETARERNFTCEKCGKTFPEMSQLKRHEKTHTMRVASVPCQICNKLFQNQTKLRLHLKVHSDVKPFICDHCGRRFRFKQHIAEHMKVHSDRKPYECPICHKTFRFHSNWKIHCRGHTGDKPYSCELCAKEFTGWSNYNKHMKRIHGKDTSKKKITTEGVFPINPETGQIVNHQDATTEEWRREVLTLKRSKKLRAYY